MFGNDHKNEDKHDNVQPMSTQPVNNGLLGIDDDSDSPATGSAPSGPPAPTPPVVSSFGGSNDGFASVSDDKEEDKDSADSPSAPTLGPSPVMQDDEPSDTPDTPSHSSSDDELLDIKKEALQELSPLIDHLEQNSEEKFRTTMMMIQASDNKSLIPQAFKAAKDISDDKKRAQALLDIVNEINYFTHKNPA